MKKIISLISASALALTMTVTVSAECESAVEAVKNINVGWNVGNSFDSHGQWIQDWTANQPADYETAWGNPVVNRQIIKSVKAAGFNTIRLPVTWYQHIDDNGNIDEVWLDRVQEVVDYIIDEGLYCVLNVHHDGGQDGWIEASNQALESNGKRFVGLWTNIAERFKDYDERLIFEGFNEVIDANNIWDKSTPEGSAALNSFNQMFVDAVRATGGNNATRNLVLQTYGGNFSDSILERFKLPEDTVDGHLILQVHNYDPWGFTGNNITWTTMTDQWDDSLAEIVVSHFDTLDDYSNKLCVPLVLGEFGATNKGNDDDRAEYAACVVSEGAKFGIKCFWWDNGYMNENGLFDRTTGEAYFPEIVEALVDNAEGDYVPPAVLQGDANNDGVVNAIDAAHILISLTDGTSLGGSADFNADSMVNALDAAAILRSLVA